MRLRNLEAKDAPFMYEWMKDATVNCWFRFDPEATTMELVKQFIKVNDNTDGVDYHYAIVDEADEYLGTVSIKNVDLIAKSGEYAIVLRSSAQGKGAGSFATKAIQKIAFEELKLHRLYLNVLSDNVHAWNFYERLGFVFEGEFIDCLKLRDKYCSLRWYRKLDSEYEK